MMFFYLDEIKPLQIPTKAIIALFQMYHFGLFLVAI